MHYPTAWVNNENNPFPLGEDKRFIESSTDYVDTWKALEKIAKSHRALSIGVSNFNSFQIERLVKEALILPVTNQIEVNPYLTNEDVVKTCDKYGITVTAYSPLGNPSKPQVFFLYLIIYPTARFDLKLSCRLEGKTDNEVD